MIPFASNNGQNGWVNPTLKVVFIGSDKETVELATLSLRLRWPDAALLVATTAAEGLTLVEQTSPDVALIYPALRVGVGLTADVYRDFRLRLEDLFLHLPVRQTYYWPKSDGEPASAGRAMLMASYDDGLNIGFWDGFRPKRGRGWRHDAQDIGEPEWFSGTVSETGEDYKEWHRFHAPEPMVAEVQRQLADVHGLKFVPKVENASFKDWGDDPFGGGWNS